MKQIVVLLALAITSCATRPQFTPIDVASIGPPGIEVDETSRPYYDCIANRVAELIGAQSDLYAAFEVARQDCSGDRDSLYSQLLQTDWVKTDGSDLSREELIDHADLMLRLVEGGFKVRLESIYKPGK